MSGQIMAFIFIILGLFMFFSGAGFGGIWIAFIGWFLLNAAKATYAQVEITEGLKGVLVDDLMSRDCPLVDRYENLQTVVDDHVLGTGERCFMVAEQGVPIGVPVANGCGCGVILSHCPKIIGCPALGQSLEHVDEICRQWSLHGERFPGRGMDQLQP